MAGRKYDIVAVGLDPDVTCGGQLERPQWMAGGACRDTPEVDFFPEEEQAAEPARAVCRACPVQAPCLAFAVEQAEMGVWGGTTALERRSIGSAGQPAGPSLRRAAAVVDMVPGVDGRVVRVDDLVGTVEIAQRLGVADHNVVNTWRRRHPGFPQPLTTLRHGRIWSWTDVEAWARATGRLTSHPSREATG